MEKTLFLLFTLFFYTFSFCLTFNVAEYIGQADKTLFKYNIDSQSWFIKPFKQAQPDLHTQLHEKQITDFLNFYMHVLKKRATKGVTTPLLDKFLTNDDRKTLKEVILLQNYAKDGKLYVYVLRIVTTENPKEIKLMITQASPAEEALLIKLLAIRKSILDAQLKKHANEQDNEATETITAQ